MEFWGGMAIGLFVGTFFGVLVHGLLQMAKKEEDIYFSHDRREEDRDKYHEQFKSRR